MNIREETELNAQKFKNNPCMILENVPPEYVMVLPFNANNAAMGTVDYHEAFSINSESLDSTVRKKI
jgi:hypothetical protein